MQRDLDKGAPTSAILVRETNGEGGVGSAMHARFLAMQRPPQPTANGGKHRAERE
eukprot:COSAG03_NODE_18771_length_348_cov_3958.867470_1_plen_54_part_10